jgi:serine/threonine protein kinase
MEGTEGALDLYSFGTRYYRPIDYFINIFRTPELDPTNTEDDYRIPGYVYGPDEKWMMWRRITALEFCKDRTEEMEFYCHWFEEPGGDPNQCANYFGSRDVCHECKYCTKKEFRKKLDVWSIGIIFYQILLNKEFPETRIYLNLHTRLVNLLNQC